jgi:DNA polymerase-3 subunit gamma/tau
MPVLGRHCAEIIASRHPDVVEMDAASNTGVDSVREIIESARYRPIAARTKVFIIDEVHMLSKGAFNALLKTLEEPPEHVKFIFATTEVRKVPVTVLSRCQRFDLRRVDVPVLAAHLTSIVASEGAKADSDAIIMIARAAEGSVRDSLSILDQVIAMAGGETVTAALVRAMLGLSDRGRILDLVEALAGGEIAKALGLFESLHRDGADPVQVLGDLAEAVHHVARIKVVGPGAASDALSADEKRRTMALGGQLSVPLLSRYWQMLQKGHAEAAAAGDPLAAAEMVLIRIAHTADLPSPDDLVRLLGGDRPERRGSPPPPGAPRNGAQDHQRAPSNASPAPGTTASNQTRASSALAPPFEPTSDAEIGMDDAFPPEDLDPALSDTGDGDAIATIDRAPLPEVTTFADVVALAGRHRDAMLRVSLEENVSLVKFDATSGSIDLFLLPGAPSTLPNDLREKLNRWTGRKWIVMVSRTQGAPTLGSERRDREARERAILEQHPAVRAVLDTFPGAKITAIKPQTVTRDGIDDTGNEETGTG